MTSDPSHNMNMNIGNRWIEVLAVFFVVHSILTLLGFGVQSLPIVKNSPDTDQLSRLISTISFQSVFLVSSVICFFYLNHPPRKELGLRRGPVLKFVLWNVATAVVSIMVCYVLNNLLHQLLQSSDLPSTEQKVVSDLRTSENPAIVYAMITSVVILAPVAEELFFRGLLYNLMAPRGKVSAMVFISVVFGLIHYSGTGESGADILSGLVRTIPFMALSGFLFTSYRLTGNILSPIVCHMLFNLFGVIATRNGG